MMNETTHESVKFINKEMFEKASQKVFLAEMDKTESQGLSGMASLAIGMQTVSIISKLREELFGEEGEDE